MYNYHDAIYIVTTPYSGCIEMGYTDDLADRLRVLNSDVSTNDEFSPYAVYLTESKNAEKALSDLIEELIPVVRVQSMDGKNLRDHELLRLSPEQGYSLLEKIAVISHTEGSLHRLINNGETEFSTVTDDPRVVLEPGKAQWFNWDDDFPVTRMKILQAEVESMPYNVKNITEAYRKIHQLLYEEYPKAYRDAGSWFSHDGRGMRISYQIAENAYVESNISTKAKLRSIRKIAKKAGLDSNDVRFFAEVK